METFLHEVAVRLLRDTQGDMSRTLVVFNNRRPAQFLRRELVREHGKGAFFLPVMMGMDDLVATLGGLKILPHEFLLFELYQVHRQVGAPSQRDEPFEDFLPLGETMLRDFSAIDLYHVDAKRLFNHLYEHKKLGEWDVEKPEPTPFQQEYLRFFASLLAYYEGLRQRLAQRGKAYGGMAYREVADHLQEYAASLPFDQVYFVGFSVLSESERIIVQGLVSEGRATLLLDGDSYYYDDPNQEAGHFLRQLHDRMRQVPEEHFHFPGNLVRDKRIAVVECPEDVMQAKYAGQLLRQAPKDHANDLTRTCVVLADEKLLLPMLNALPAEVRGANVTMGLPYSYSWLHPVLLALLHLHRDRRNGDGAFYHRHVLALLGDSHMEELMHATNLRPRLQARLAEEKLAYLTKDEVLEQLRALGADPAPVAFLLDDAQPAELIQICLRLISLLDGRQEGRDDAEARQTLLCATEVFDYLRTLQDTYHYFNTIATLETVYGRLAARHSVALYGEPLQGLQILGVLETRCLDFSRLVILSANEGVVPSGRVANSLIPFALKREYGLPTYAESDAVYAYHFYRMLQRAKDITIVYQSDSRGMGSGGPSRYVLQLRDELAQGRPGIQYSECTLSVDSAVFPHQAPDSHAKTPEDMLALRRLAESGLSPTALNVYRRCPMSYYVQYVLGAKEDDGMEEDIDAREMGEFVHDMLRDIYGQDPHGQVRADTLQRSLDGLDDAMRRKFNDHYQRGRTAEGMSHYYLGVAREQIAALLGKEIGLLRHEGKTLQMLKMEADLECELAPGVRIKGRVDRIDRLDGQLRVIDYKTGKVNPADLKGGKDKKISDKMFQVLAYAWLYAQQSPATAQPMQCGIYPLGSLREGFLPVSWEDQTDITPDTLDCFAQEVRALAEGMLNKDIPFEATPSKEGCLYCGYGEVCPKVKRGNDR